MRMLIFVPGIFNKIFTFASGIVHQSVNAFCVFDDLYGMALIGMSMG